MKNTILTPILLPTKDASILGINPKDVHEHLYLTSDAEIKEGDWFYDKSCNGIFIRQHSHRAEIKNYSKAIFIVNKDCQKIEFTTDPKLIADGVTAINGNTKALIPDDFPHQKYSQKEVNFLTEFCKRWNENGIKETIMFDAEKPYIQKDNQKVDVKKYGNPNDHLIQIPLNDYVNEKHNQDECSGFIDGFKVCQALQSIGGYSLEDIIAFGKFVDEYYNEERAKIEVEIMFEEFIQSLTPQPKGDMVIEVEMEKDPIWKDGKTVNSEWKIKLKNGQPTLIFK